MRSFLSIFFIVSLTAFPAQANPSKEVARQVFLCGLGALQPEVRIEECTTLLQTNQLDSQLEAFGYNFRGIAYADLGQFTSAIEDYDQAIRLNPEDASAFIRRGLAFYSLKQYERAVEDYDRAIGISSTDADVYIYRGSALSKLGEGARAIEDFNQAILLDPEESVAYSVKAWHLATHKSSSVRDGREAVKAAQKAVSLDGENAQHLRILAAAYAEDGQFSKAVKQQERAIQLLRDQGKIDNIAVFESHLSLYKQGRPHREE